MIIRKDIDIFKCTESQGIIHQANCQCTMGSGIAKQIRKIYPEAYMADCQTTAGDIKKLGRFSWIKAKDGKYIYNCYSQFYYGVDKRHTNYEAMFTGLTSIKSHAIVQEISVLSLPHNMGCKLGGGSWHIVNAIIEDVFNDDQMTLYICRYEV